MLYCVLKYGSLSCQNAGSFALRLPTATRALVLNHDARAGSVHRDLRVRLQHHDADDDDERGAGEPPVFEDRREPIEQMDGLRASRSGKRRRIQRWRDVAGRSWASNIRRRAPSLRADRPRRCMRRRSAPVRGRTLDATAITPAAVFENMPTYHDLRADRRITVETVCPGSTSKLWAHGEDLAALRDEFDDIGTACNFGEQN